MSTPSRTIQIHCLNKGHYSVADDIKNALQKKNITCIDSTPTDEFPVIVSIILFNDATDNALLEETIKGCCIQHRQRIVAISLMERPLVQPFMWELLTIGAADVLNWRTTINPTQIIISKIERWLHIEKMMASPKVKAVLAGRSGLWQNTVRDIIEAAIYSQAPILIMGETGTGKEVIANLIHTLDIRSVKQDLILLDCSSVVPELAGSEFFGHEKGAFTNALTTRDGAFSLADKGTLFLDEVGELPLNLQADLLRVIQEGTYKRVGSNTWKQSHFRLICATNRDLQHEVRKRRFREDLFYRISTWVFRLPALRERREDIIELSNFFMKQILASDKVPPLETTVINYLQTREYAGNVRELRQVISRIMARHAAGLGPVTIGDIAEIDRPYTTILKDPLSTPEFSNAINVILQRGCGLKELVNDISNIAKDIAIRNANGNLQIAAQILNVTDRTLQAYQAVKRGISLPPSIGEA